MHLCDQPGTVAETCIITIRDFLTNKHAFTLPASRLTSYKGTLKHTCRSLFRNAKAFEVHLHLSVHENDCATPVEKRRWKRGEYFKEGHITLWAHFVRIPGVDLYGYPLGEQKGKETEKPFRTPLERASKSTGNNSTELAGEPAGYSLPLPARNPYEYSSTYTKGARLPNKDYERFSNSGENTPLRPGSQRPVAASTHGTNGTVNQGSVSACQSQLSRSESPLFEPDVEIKRECLSPGIFDDDGVFEWTYGGC